MRFRIVICIGIRRGAYPRARFREAEQIARKGDVARVNEAIPYRYLPPANCIRSECRTNDVVPTAENARFRFFRWGSVVDPCGRVDTRPYAGLAVVRRARGYAPLQA